MVRGDGLSVNNMSDFCRNSRSQHTSGAKRFYFPSPNMITSLRVINAFTFVRGNVFMLHALKKTSELNTQHTADWIGCIYLCYSVMFFFMMHASNLLNWIKKIPLLLSPSFFHHVVPGSRFFCVDQGRNIFIGHAI